ncbi:hypothetical protein [Streptomyces sp. NPDC058755]|uniref:hypothetical protein n=1 Tax=Streptomyces sp. NPDC058755 TaxID=3346624 RepID=UPI0036C2C8FD
MVSELQARLPELGERMAQRIRSDVDAYKDESLIPFDSLRRSCTANAEARTHPEVTDAQLVSQSAEIRALFGRYAEAVAAAYRETTAKLAPRRRARRSALVEALFTGVIADRTLWEAAREHLVADHDGDIGERSGLVGVDQRDVDKVRAAGHRGDGDAGVRGRAVVARGRHRRACPSGDEERSHRFGHHQASAARDASPLRLDTTSSFMRGKRECRPRTGSAHKGIEYAGDSRSRPLKSR